MDCLTLEQVQEILNMKRAFIYELFNSKDFPSFKVGASWRVTKDDFEKWVAEQKKKSKER